MAKAIERYLKDLKKDASWRQPQNGSTFFNSGYVDFLDKNFVPDENVARPTTQGANRGGNNVFLEMLEDEM